MVAEGTAALPGSGHRRGDKALTDAMSATVKVSPAISTLKLPNAVQQFNAAVTGAGSQGVTWLVNGISRRRAVARPDIGLPALYTAPADVPKSD